MFFPIIESMVLRSLSHRGWREPVYASSGDVNFEELARSCDDFNGAQLKAVCVEAGMLALRREAEQVRDFSFWLCCY